MKVAIVAVCSPQYLPQYRILYNSIQKHCPDIYSLLYYGSDNMPVGMPNASIYSIKEWIDKSPYKEDWVKYCSIRPRAILDAFNRGYDRVFLVGADTEFYHHPRVAEAALDDNDAFVTMYTFLPYGVDEKFPNDGQTLQNGQIQGDFIGFKKNEKTIKFLEWADKVLQKHAHYNGRLVLDQFWLNYCFSLLDSVKVMRQLGINVGNYNMHNNGMQWKDGKWVMGDGSPLILFHFNGHAKGNEEQISKHQNRYIASGELLEFLRQYSGKL